MITKVKFSMHDGKEVIANIENYNAQDVADKINNKNNGEEIVVFDNKGFSKFAVKYYEPIEE